ncbi:hypothetical protein FRB94_011129 [Tulasnella sp. JGI-2019a]|nr:hypothetical protein FRB94_011129 [Tulasnella sp. JGI-2019a]KAG9029537.1 hypothetical protein FRB95_005211 [Tulasnella sp. JGI-2019a]
MQLAKSSVDLVISRVLWGFDILKAHRADGTTIELDMFAFRKPALMNIPAPFECMIQARSPHHAAVIRQEFVDSTSVLADSEKKLGQA